jgi:hypothetical protein
MGRGAPEAVAIIQRELQQQWRAAGQHALQLRERGWGDLGGGNCTRMDATARSQFAPLQATSGMRGFRRDV